MRSKKALMNVIVSFSLQIVTMICGFIVPRMIMQTYGSVVNGTITSITQFLGYIVLLEGGVGGVVKAALYNPLSKNDIRSISATVKATEHFFRIVALVFAGYTAIVACLFPLLVSNEFDFLFTFSLVFIIGISTFAQYYFGLTYQVLVQADQKRYITSALQIATVILNAILVVALIKRGFSVHIVKLCSAAVFVIRPLFLFFYVRKKYGIVKDVEPDNSSIKQRWDGFGHHIAFFIHTNTDVVILSIFSRISDSIGMAEVSVYGVYYSIVAGVEKLTSTLSAGIEASFGNMIANDEHETLNRNFNLYEFVSFLLTSAAFSAAGILILPFVTVYTRNIGDANYIRPAFAYILTFAEAMYCVRIPYNSVTLAAGHYRQTRNGAFLEAGINIVLSAVLVIPFGISGVAAATLIAMTFRTVEYVCYLSKNILKRKVGIFFKRLLINLAACAVAIFAASFIPNDFVNSYFSWAGYAVIIFALCTAVSLAFNALFFRKDFIGTLRLLRNTIHNK